MVRRMVPIAAIACMVMFWTIGEAWAVPSFTRQTGLACNACHSVPPELTAFGRQFKLHGYTLSMMKQDVQPGGPSLAGLELNEAFPLSAMFQFAGTEIAEAEPASRRFTTQFPQQLSLFLAGEITPYAGAFVQGTYTQQDDHFTLDNTDFRFVGHGTLGGKHVAYGATLNNNPTVEDLWNSTPAWGFPWSGPDSVPEPAASPVVAGALAQDVAGAGAYAMWNEWLYGDITVYGSAHLAGPQPPTGTAYMFNINDVAPYWRVAAQHAWGSTYLMVGTYGMYVSSFPQAIAGQTDTYTDFAFDSQLEQSFGAHLITAHGTYIRENSDLRATLAMVGGAGITPTHHLNTVQADATYHYGNRFTASLGGFWTNGDANPLLYTPGPVTGSANSEPDTNGFIAQVGYWPWENVDLTVAYTGYTKFNGAGQNYDGAGRNASDNNSLYVLAWLIF